MVSVWIMTSLSVRKNVHGVCLDNVLCVCSDKCLQYSMAAVWNMFFVSARKNVHGVCLDNVLFVSASKLFLESVWIIGYWKDFHN